MTAFMVSTGEYSYYRIFAVCLDRAEAESLAEWLGNTGDGAYEVEEIDIGDGWRDNKTEVLIMASTIYADHTDLRERFERWIGDPPHNAYSGPCKVTVTGNHREQYVRVKVEGTNHERVRKVLSEQVAIAKADWPVIVEAARLARLEEWKANHTDGPIDHKHMTCSKCKQPIHRDAHEWGDGHPECCPQWPLCGPNIDPNG